MTKRWAKAWRLANASHLQLWGPRRSPAAAIWAWDEHDDADGWDALAIAASLALDGAPISELP